MKIIYIKETLDLMVNQGLVKEVEELVKKGTVKLINEVPYLEIIDNEKES